MNMKNNVYITGVCGTVGLELAKYYIDKGFYVIGTDINENEIVVVEKSIKNEKVKFIPFDAYSDEALNLMDTLKPDIVIHSAVIKNTKYNEIYRDYYHNVNVENTKKLVNKVLNSEYVKRFIFLSSDEAYNPVNFFGKDKLEVEEVIRTVNSNDKIVQAVRFPFILESKGSVFHIFRNQAKNDLPLTVTHKDIKKIATDIKSFIDIWAEFDDKILENGIFNFEIGREISIYELAVDIIKGMKSSSNIVISGLREGEVLDRKIIKSNEEKIYDRIFKLN